jgi:hypothetical protein
MNTPKYNINQIEVKTDGSGHFTITPINPNHSYNILTYSPSDINHDYVGVRPVSSPSNTNLNAGFDILKGYLSLSLDDIHTCTGTRLTGPHTFLAVTGATGNPPATNATVKIMIVEWL